jgi:potassium-transporting ATPase KdpC subunit
MEWNLIFKQFKPALVALLLLTVITGVLYPLLVTGVAQAIFPSQANGSLIEKDGRILGSALIGQPFDKPGYFWSRPSATSPFPYNAALGSGTNLGPNNPLLLQQVSSRAQALRAADPANQVPIPVDLVTSSASGLDPDISVAAAMYQAPRVARERGLTEQQVLELIAQVTEARQLGFLGEPRVNVLKLNLALDGLK